MLQHISLFHNKHMEVCLRCHLIRCICVAAQFSINCYHQDNVETFNLPLNCNSPVKQACFTRGESSPVTQVTCRCLTSANQDNKHLQDFHLHLSENKQQTVHEGLFINVVYVWRRLWWCVSCLLLQITLRKAALRWVTANDGVGRAAIPTTATPEPITAQQTLMSSKYMLWNKEREISQNALFYLSSVCKHEYLQSPLWTLICASICVRSMKFRNHQPQLQSLCWRLW